MRLFAILLFLFVIQFCQAQFPSELWHEGKVVLLTGDTLKGAIKYDLNRDIIQLNDARTIEAYTARKVLYFNIFDETINNYRQFYALPYNVTPDYKTPIFFEVLLEGVLTLLAREFITIQTTSYGPTAMSGSFSRRVLAYKYYFLNDLGNIVEYKKSKKELLDYMRHYDNEIKDFVKRNRLKYDEKQDLIYIVEYYNSLIDPKR